MHLLSAIAVASLFLTSPSTRPPENYRITYAESWDNGDCMIHEITRVGNDEMHVIAGSKETTYFLRKDGVAFCTVTSDPAVRYVRAYGSGVPFFGTDIRAGYLLNQDAPKNHTWTFEKDAAGNIGRAILWHATGRIVQELTMISRERCDIWELIPEDIGVFPTINLDYFPAHGRTGESMAWDGEKIITKKEFIARRNAGEFGGPRGTKGGCPKDEICGFPGGLQTPCGSAWLTCQMCVATYTCPNTHVAMQGWTNSYFIAEEFNYCLTKATVACYPMQACKLNDTECNLSNPCAENSGTGEYSWVGADRYVEGLGGSCEAK